MVDRVEIVEIETPVREPGRIEPVYEIIVRRDRDGPQPAGLELDAEPLAEGRLSGTGRSCDKDDLAGVFRPVAPFDLFSDLDDLLFLQGFRDLDQLARLTGLAGVVDVSDGVEAHDDVPPQVLGEHPVGLGLVHEGGEPGRIVPVRDPEQHAVVVEADVPDGQVSGRRDEFPIEIIRGIPEGVIVRIGLPAGLQQADLVLVPALPEGLDSLLGMDIIAVEGDVFLDDNLHPLLEERDVLRSDRHPVSLSEVAEKAVRDGVFHEDTALREDVRRGFAEQETERAAVGPHAAGLAHVDEFNVLVLVDPEFQALGNVIDLGGDNRVRLVERKLAEHLQEAGAFLEPFGRARVLAVDLDHGYFAIRMSGTRRSPLWSQVLLS